MTLQMLRCFAAVAESNSFAQAANQLYITQPAITHQIQALETELGVCLIDRTQRPARLTASGISFYNDVSDILNRLSLAVDHVRDSAPFSDTLHIGCQSTIQLHFLPAIYRAYNQCCPDIYISSIELSDIRRGDMLSAPLNVAFLTRDCADEQKNIRYISLYEGSFCCVVPQNHRLADRDMISAQDFEGEVLIMLDTAHCPPQMNELLTGLRKALGAEPSTIQIQFLMESIILSVLGGIIGILLGELISYAAAQMMGLDFALNMSAIALDFGFSLGVGVLFGRAPTRNASRLNSINALRRCAFCRANSVDHTGIPSDIISIIEIP